MSHHTDPQLRQRLRRAHGHLGVVVSMVEEGRDALDLAQQMQAVIRALESAKAALITHHIEHHLEAAAGPLDAAAREELARLAKLARYL